jgi:hypothetical protein
VINVSGRSHRHRADQRVHPRHRPLVRTASPRRGRAAGLAGWKAD